jgi:thiol-disulfide isomerase/thioredoxin
MRLDPKYFNTFLFIVAIIAALLIAFFTLSNRSDERSDFSERIRTQDSLKTVWWPRVEQDDSLRISDLKGQIVVLDFWSNWSDVSTKSHKKLADIKSQYPNSLEIIAAAVGLQKEEVVSYMQKNKFPFYFAAGSQHFSSFNVPGLPAQIIYDTQGDIRHVFLGYPDESQYDSLRALVTNDKQ